MSASNINGTILWTNPNGQVYSANGPSSNCTVSTCPVQLSVYGYRPSIAASGALIGLYSICTVVQIVLGLRYKSWWFMTCMIWGSVDEILGYVGRILYWQNPWGHAGFIMQIVLITIGPVFFAGAIYVLLSQVIDHIGPQYSRVPPHRYIWTFVPCDIVSLVLQAVGGAMSSTSNGKSETGVHIALAGLAFQVFTLLVFIALTTDFAVRSRHAWSNTALDTRFKVFCVALAAATTAILVRCVYRIYELSEGYTRTSKALRDEPLFIALESAMVIFAAYCLILAHPGPLSIHNKSANAETKVSPGLREQTENS